MSWFADLEDLVASAVTATGHGEDLAAAHLAADGRIEAAALGWTGRSAAALAQRAAHWSRGVDGAGHPHRRARPGSAHLRPGVRVHRGAAARALAELSNLP